MGCVCRCYAWAKYFRLVRSETWSWPAYAQRRDSGAKERTRATQASPGQLLDVPEKVPGGEMHICGQVGNSRYWRRWEATALQRFCQRPAIKTLGKLLDAGFH